VLQAGDGDARHLHGHVGPHAHHPLRHRIHQPEGLRRQGRPRPAQQRALELDQRRFHALVTEGGEALDGDVDGAGLARRVGRQQVGKAGGQEAAMVVVVGGHGGGAFSPSAPPRYAK
jgi:hypothetical protein